MAVAKKSKTETQQVIGLSANSEDLKLIQELQAWYRPKLGPVSNAQLIRMGLIKLAEAEGLR